MNRNQRFHELSLTAHELHLLCIMVASSGCNLNALQGNAAKIIHFCLSDGMTHESFPAYNGRFVNRPYDFKNIPQGAFLVEEGGFAAGKDGRS